MRLSELIERYQRQKTEAEQIHATAPLGSMLGMVLEDLRSLDGIEVDDRMLTTSEAADLLGVARKTVAAWASNGRFPRARKTSKSGEWRISSREVYRLVGQQPEGRYTTPKLWEPTDG